MGYWPFVTIFISLILILFFRRIDKRRINFSKFKRYAEKLSEDFNGFLAGKKEEMGSHIEQLDAALQKAETLVSRLEASQELLKGSHVKLQDEKSELDTIKREMEKLKGLKEEISNEVTILGKNLPSLKGLSSKLDRIALNIAENEKAIRNTSALIPTLERRVQDKSEKAIEDARNQILEEARSLFGSLVDEYRKNLDDFSAEGMNALERFKRETNDILGKTKQNITGFMDTVQACQDKLSEVEDGKLRVIEKQITDLGDLMDGTKEKLERVERETVDAFINRAEDEYKRYMLLLEESQSSFKNGIFEKVENEAKDLSSYVSRLEGRVQSLLNNIKEETDKYGEVLNLKAKTHESETDALKSRIISEINEEANKNLLLIKPIVSEMNEKLVASRKEFSTLYSRMQSSLESQEDKIKLQIEGFAGKVEQHKKQFVEQLNKPIEGAIEQINGITEQLNSRIADATSTVSGEFVSRLKEYEGKIHTLEGRIGDLKNIADAGQEMIEERIDSVFRNYKPEIVKKIRSLKEETEQLYSQERERIVDKIGTIISESDSELEKRENQLKVYIGDIEKKMQESEEKLSGQESEITENLSRVKFEAREELIRELENLKSLFKEEKERSIERFREELAGVNEKIDTINEEVTQVQGTVESKIEEALGNVDGSVKEIETSYLKTEDELKEQLRANLDGIRVEVDGIKTKVDRLKGDVVKDVSDALEYFRKDVEKEISGQRENIYEKGRDLQDLVNSLAEGAKSELTESHKDASQKLSAFSSEVGEVQEGIETRITGIEKRISDFEKDSTVLRRAVKFKDKVEEDIERFSDIMVGLKQDKKEIMSLKKVVENLKRDEGDIAAKVRQLKSEKKLVQDIAKNAEQAIGLIAVVDEKIKLIESERELLDHIESSMKNIEGQFDSLKQKAEKLAGREKDIEVSIETISKTKEFISNLEQRTDLLKENLSDIREREEEMKNKITLIDEKTGSLLAYENRIEEVLAKFKEMDSLVQDIEERSKQLQNTREWLARVESRLTNLTKDAERLVDEMKSTGISIPEGAPAKGKAREDRPAVFSRESDSKVKTVLTLFEQKWTIPEICKVTKMSRGEVELILELNNR
jgi:chromosome segregation ATPase